MSNSPSELIPLELLQTFMSVLRHDGNATKAALSMGISQPTISKRITQLKQLLIERGSEPWLLLQGKRWKLTPEGHRVHGTVIDLMDRYHKMQELIDHKLPGGPKLSIACGQKSASGLVRSAAKQMLVEHPDCQLRISTLRGKSRIEGVAGGQFDFALVSDSVTAIHQTARMELYEETLYEDRFVLAANPSSGCNWVELWNDLPSDSPLSARNLAGIPLILPEPDSARRRQFEEFISKVRQQVNISIESGGWQVLLEFAAIGLGATLATESAVARNFHGQLSCRRLSPRHFPAEPIRVIARRRPGSGQPDLSSTAEQFLEHLRAAADS